jgi:hypothetical protein
MFRFIAGREPSRLDIVPEAAVTLDGLVTGVAGGVPSNRPVAEARIEVYRVDPETGQRMGAPVHVRTTGTDGQWGPVRVEPSWALEFVLALPGHPVTHIYRSPFPRSSSVVHLRPGRALAQADAGAGAVVLLLPPARLFRHPPRCGAPRRPRAQGRDPGRRHRRDHDPAPAAGEVGPPVVGLFNEERIVARAWPAAENRITIAELTF